MKTGLLFLLKYTKYSLMIILLFALSQSLIAQQASKSELARQLLENQLRTSQLDLEDLTEMQVSSESFSNRSGVTHVYFKQHVEGIPVFNAVLNVHITQNDELLTFGNRFIENARSKINTTVPVLTPEEAVMAAARQLGYEFSGELVRKEVKGEGVSQLIMFDKADLSLEDISVKLTWQPMDDGKLYLAWELAIYELSAQNCWNSRIDALTGELLHKNNWVVSCNFDHPEGEACNHTHDHHTNEKNHVKPSHFEFYFPSSRSPNDGSSYRVFPPPIESPIHGARQLISEPADPTASPFGWHDTDGTVTPNFTITRGNNVHAYADTEDTNTPDPGSEPDGGAGLDFDFPIDFADEPEDYMDAAITNLFFWNNFMHDWTYNYGFDEVAGNFQVNNYGNGGVAGDDVRAEAMDGSGMNNANFFTPADGSRPRMQMYLFDYTSPMRTSDLDGGVIAHEYGHGISNRLTGGPANVDCLSNSTHREHMGEGWSDYYLYMATLVPGEDPAVGRGVGTYSFGQPIDGTGIRPTKYSTDMTVNPSTYETIKTVSQPHGVGYVWASMLWDMTWLLIEEYGFQDGYDISMNLVMEGMKLQPCPPGFVDGRDAILAADVALYSSDNQCLIWAAFTRRGLGVDADQGSPNSRADGTENFEMHPDFEVEPAIDCPADIEVAAAPGQNTLSMTEAQLGAPVTTVIACVPSTLESDFDDQFPSGDVPIGFHEITWTLTDYLGRSVTCKQQLNVFPAYYLKLKVFLQGAYDPPTDEMWTVLRAAGQIPNDQPYGDQPWDHTGNEEKNQVVQIPSKHVDWVLIELRSDPNTSAEKKAGILMDDGTVVVDFDDFSDGVTPYYVVVYHRNHLPVMSSVPIVIPAAGTSYDFTDLANVFGQGAIEIDPGVFGMIAGDVNQDGMIKYSGPNNDRGPILAFLYDNVPPPAFINSTLSDGYWFYDTDLLNDIAYIGSPNDRSVIIANIFDMMNTTLLTAIYESPVPSTNTLKSNELIKQDGPVDLKFVSMGDEFGLVLTTNEMIREGILDNLQFTLAWYESDSEIEHLVSNFNAEFGLQPQGEVVTEGGIRYQTYASIIPSQLPLLWNAYEELRALWIDNPTGFYNYNRIWIADDEYTTRTNGAYYVSVWGKDHTGFAQGTAVSVDDHLTGNAIRIYPNPVTNGVLRISFQGIESQQIHLSIMDVSGKLLSSESLEVEGMHTSSINIQQLEPGVYVAKLSGNNLLYQQKFVVLKK